MNERTVGTPYSVVRKVNTWTIDVSITTFLFI